MREARNTLVFSILSMGCALLLLFHATSERYSAGIADYGFSPVFFPEILLFVWLALSLLLAAKATLSILSSATNLGRETSETSFVKPFLCFCLSVFYTFLITKIGFLFASIIFSIFFIRLFGYDRWSVAIPISLIFPIVIWYVFNFSLHVPLPTSPWFSRI